MKKYIIIIICIFTIILLFACGIEDNGESLDNSSEFIESDDNSKQGESQESSIEESSAEESSEIPEESSEEPIDYIKNNEVVRTLYGGKYYFVAKEIGLVTKHYALVTSDNELIIDFSDCHITQKFDMTIVWYKENYEPSGVLVINSEGEIIIPLNKYRVIYYTGEYFIAGLLNSPDELYTILNKDTSVFETDIKFNGFREYTTFYDFTTFELAYMIEGKKTLYYQLWYDSDTQSIMLEAFDRMKAVEEHLGIFMDMVQRAVEAAKTDDRETLAELLTEELYNNYVDYLNGDIIAAYRNGIYWLINEEGTGDIYVLHKDVELYEENLKHTHNYMRYINFRKGGTTSFYFYWEHMEPIQQRGAWFISDGEGNFKISNYAYGLDM